MDEQPGMGSVTEVPLGGWCVMQAYRPPHLPWPEPLAPGPCSNGMRATISARDRKGISNQIEHRGELREDEHLGSGCYRLFNLFTK